jgi:hypothetical protein
LAQSQATRTPPERTIVAAPVGGAPATPNAPPPPKRHPHPPGHADSGQPNRNQ